MASVDSSDAYGGLSQDFLRLLVASLSVVLSFCSKGNLIRKIVDFKLTNKKVMNT